jgi:hypothetical protein
VMRIVSQAEKRVESINRARSKSPTSRKVCEKWGTHRLELWEHWARRPAYLNDDTFLQVLDELTPYKIYGNYRTGLSYVVDPFRYRFPAENVARTDGQAPRWSRKRDTATWGGLLPVRVVVLLRSASAGGAYLRGVAF